MRKRSQRLWLIGAAALLTTGAVALAVVALQDTVAFFQSPSDIVEKGVGNLNQSVRVGGLVEKGSETHGPENSKSFSVGVVLPASGWEMMAKVRRRATSAVWGLADTVLGA